MFFSSPFSLSGAVQGRPELVFGAAVAFVLAGVAVVAAPERIGLVIGGLSGWVLWFAGVTILAAWLILILAGRPLLALLMAGVVAAASGAFLFYNPYAGALAITILAASALVMDGGLQIALALRLHPAGAWRWLFASALASMIAAALAAREAFQDPAAGLALPVGVALLTSGAALALLGRDVRRSAVGA